jgi:hypothetical protein
LLSRPQANVWTSWAFSWNLPSSGRYKIEVRATNFNGVRQPELDKGVDQYDGRTSWHSVPVNIATTYQPIDEPCGLLCRLGYCRPFRPVPALRSVNGSH